jgi:hypothetical protein
MRREDSTRQKFTFVNQMQLVPCKNWYSWGFETTKHVEQG